MLHGQDLGCSRQDCVNINGHVGSQTHALVVCNWLDPRKSVLLLFHSQRLLR